MKVCNSGLKGFSRDREEKIAQASEATPLGKVSFPHVIPFQSVCLAFDAHLFAFVTNYKR